MLAAERGVETRSSRLGDYDGISDGALAIVTAVGLIALTLSGLYARELWKFALFSTALAAFGARGIFDRSSINPPWLSSLLRVVTTMVGWISAFAALFFALEFGMRVLKH